MEEQKANNLPIEVKPKALLNDHPKLAKFTDGILKGVKIVAGTTLFILGAGISASNALVGLGIVTVGATEAVRNGVAKTMPGLMFCAIKSGDKLKFSQDLTNLLVSTRMAGYSNFEKAGMMGLQTLVGFSRCKHDLQGTPFEIDENGQKVYSQKFTTTTHSINLKNLEALETLGYIKIDFMDSKFEPESLMERISRHGKDPNKEHSSYLVMEKIGFGNWNDIVGMIKARFSRDPAKLERYKMEMKKVVFRMTDKPIDYEQMKLYVTDLKSRKSLSPEIDTALRNLSPNIVRTMNARKLSVGQDIYGRDKIEYSSRLENMSINMKRRVNRIKNLLRKRSEKKEEQKKAKEVAKVKTLSNEQDGSSKVDFAMEKMNEQKEKFEANILVENADTVNINPTPTNEVSKDTQKNSDERADELGEL